MNVIYKIIFVIFFHFLHKLIFFITHVMKDRQNLSSQDEISMQMCQCCPEAAPLSQSRIFSHDGPLEMHFYATVVSSQIGSRSESEVVVQLKASVKTPAMKKSRKIPCFLSDKSALLKKRLYSLLVYSVHARYSKDKCL